MSNLKIKFNDKGLVPVIVQDYYSGKVLMFAYANQEAYDYMLANNETCFYSRSRNEQWHKGETSGNTQEIVSMAVDCDSDTLLVQVKQNGIGACHLNTFSCFDGGEKGQFSILDDLYKQIEDRAHHPVEKSYTNYLLDSGLDKICKKVGEEATETIIAAKNNHKEDVIEELSDLAYHLMVLMYQQGVSLDDLKAKLVERHEVSGNLKVKNTKGDY